ncbi:hypothetical protein SAMN05518849_11655 [Sphingobium sp. AP50]|uniref:hypothetical protein n=1 Tax=Sphingobium sp. AP50 TaxID=1884369 RepID=UPI0008D7B739|nr:hypothetical protein [Sphingobium sp. AP50]SEJ87106.1 hypothetical protein SAMN05518849_11655 [Sphingobium sp. AP50]
MKCMDLHDFLADIDRRKAELGIVDRDPEEVWAEAVARKVRKLERLAELAEAGDCTDISGLDRYERRWVLWGHRQEG